MTEQPVNDEASSDLQDEELLLAHDTDGSPAVLALVAFVLAVSSVLTLGVMNGATYILPILTSEGPQSRGVTAALAGAMLALLPAALGWRASSRTLPSDPAWVFAVARAAMALALLAGLLRLVVAVILAVNGETAGFSRV